MSDGTLTQEGNLRLLSQRFDGLPSTLEGVHDDVCSAANTQGGLQVYGPIQTWFDLPPMDPDQTTWACQVGTAVTGQPDGSVSPLIIEDYNGLQALSKPFLAPLAELQQCHADLVQQAKAMGWTVRPYWRLSCIRTSTPDGHLLPEVTVSVFVDR